ncbi:MAG: hypothetical protein IKR81_12150 [Victivallales bacterium]|nr:hypothetical protein [Victivallales bacterium]
MDISINRSNSVNQAGFEVSAPAVQSKGGNMEKPMLSITSLSANEDVSLGNDIPDAALSREDALGKFVNSAFNLPPPAMPKFG